MNNLLQKEQDAPFDRSLKQQVIALARSQNLMAEANAARFRLLEYFPLTETEWMQWLEDESSPDLFRKALKDFLYPTVACTWIHDCQASARPVDADLVRRVNTPQIWDAYRTGLTQEADIRLTYEEQLSLPSAALPSVWKNYQDWEPQKSRVPAAQARYLSVFALYKKLEPLYAQIALDVSHSAKEVIAVHTEELTKQLQLTAGCGVYEQTLISFPSVTTLWKAYVTFLNEKQAGDGAVRRTLKRAVRNCYWELSLHLDLLLVTESMRKPIDRLFTQALQSPYPAQTDYVTLWKHKYEWAKRTQSDPQSVAEAALSWLQQYTQGCHTAFQLYIASGLSQEDARNTYEDVVREQGGCFSNWYYYAKWLEQVGDVKALRSVLRRGLEFTKDLLTEMSDFYLEMENKYGDVEEIRQARMKVYKRLKRAEEAAPKPHIAPPTDSSPVSKPSTPIIKDSRHTVFLKNLSPDVREDELQDLLSQVAAVQNVRIVRDLKGRSRGIAYVDLTSEEELTKCVDSFNGTMLDGKKILVAASAPPAKANKDAKTIFVNNLPFELTDDELLAVFSPIGKVSDVRVIRNPQGLCRGFGYIEFEDEKSIPKALELSEVTIKGRPAKLSQANSVREQATVLFVSNLDYSVSEDDLRATFPGIKEVEIPKDADGRSKGFAFVGFEREEDAKFVMGLKETVIKGRPAVVKRSTREIKPKKSNSDFKKFL